VRDCSLGQDCGPVDCGGKRVRVCLCLRVCMVVCAFVRVRG